MPYDILIIPGWQNSEPEHWQSIWQGRYGYHRVEQAEWMYPKREAWVHRLATVVAEYENPILVTHSLGCHIAAIVSAETQAKISGAFLVCPVDMDQHDTPEEIKNFGRVPLTPLRFPSMVVASDTDQYCSIHVAARIAKAWGSTFVNIGSHGHINVAAGFGPWEEGHKLLQSFLLSLIPLCFK